MTSINPRNAFREDFLRLAHEIDMLDPDAVTSEPRELDDLVRRNGSMALSVIRELALTGPASGYRNFSDHEVTWNWLIEYAPTLGDVEWRIQFLRDALRGSFATRLGILGAVTGWGAHLGPRSTRRVIGLLERHAPKETGYLRADASDTLAMLREEYLFEQLARSDSISFWLDDQREAVKPSFAEVEDRVQRWMSRGGGFISMWDVEGSTETTRLIAVNLACQSHGLSGKWMILVPREYLVHEEVEGEDEGLEVGGHRPAEVTVSQTRPERPPVKGLDGLHFDVQGDVAQIADAVYRAVRERRFVQIDKAMIRSVFRTEYLAGRIVRSRVRCTELRKMMDVEDAEQGRE